MKTLRTLINNNTIRKADIYDIRLYQGTGSCGDPLYARGDWDDMEDAGIMEQVLDAPILEIGTGIVTVDLKIQ